MSKASKAVNQGEAHAFRAQLTSKGPGDGWKYILIPLDVPTVFGTRGRVPVAGTLNGVPYRSSIMPEGDGTHSLNVTKALMAAAHVRPGDIVEVTMAVDLAERTVEVPYLLVQAFAAHPAAETAFDALPYSHRKQYVDWILSAKREETRQTRTHKTIERLESSTPRFD